MDAIVWVVVGRGVKCGESELLSKGLHFSLSYLCLGLESW